MGNFHFPRYSVSHHIQVIQCLSLLFHVFQFPHHIPCFTVCVFHFLRFLVLTHVRATGQEERNKPESSAAKALLLTSSGAREQEQARALLLTSSGAREESKRARARALLLTSSGARQQSKRARALLLTSSGAREQERKRALLLTSLGAREQERREQEREWRNPVPFKENYPPPRTCHSLIGCSPSAELSSRGRQSTWGGELPLAHAQIICLPLRTQDVSAILYPYSRSYSVCFSFSTFFSFLAIFYVLRCEFLILYDFQFSPHIQGPTVSICLFPRFSVFLAIFQVIQCAFLIFHVFQVSLHIPGPTVCNSHFSRYSGFLVILQDIQCFYLIFHIFQVS